MTPKPNTTNSELREILKTYGFFVLNDKSEDKHVRKRALDNAVSEIEALIASKVEEARIDELETIKKRATEHCAFKIDQYGSDLDTKDVRLAIPNKKIDDRLATLKGDTNDPT